MIKQIEEAAKALVAAIEGTPEAPATFRQVGAAVKAVILGQAPQVQRSRRKSVVRQRLEQAATGEMTITQRKTPKDQLAAAKAAAKLKAQQEAIKEREAEDAKEQEVETVDEDNNVLATGTLDEGAKKETKKPAPKKAVKKKGLND
jgi:hypothetical protein